MPAPVATRLRTASTERVRKATRRACAERGQQLAGILLDLLDGQHDQRLRSDIAPADDVRRLQPVAERQPEPVGRNLEDLGLQRHPVAQVGDHHDRDVQFAADQQMLQIVAIVLDGLDRHVGIGAAEAGQECRTGNSPRPAT